MEETGVPGENHRPDTSNWQTSSHNAASSTTLHVYDDAASSTTLHVYDDVASSTTLHVYDKVSTLS